MTVTFAPSTTGAHYSWLWAEGSRPSDNWPVSSAHSFLTGQAPKDAPNRAPAMLPPISAAW